MSDPSLRANGVARLLKRLPRLTGQPIRLLRVPGLRDQRGPVHAGAFLRERRIALDCSQREFDRILVHELFHFAWVRLGNRRRWSYEELLRAELRSRTRGELGWSADWRKQKLRAADIQARTRNWREYCCESFCDSAAWLYGGAGKHEEFTLGAQSRDRRAAWFRKITAAGPLSI